MLTATGERDMGRLGGLLNRMPATGLFMLIGCAAISALPPLNGFVSEWLMLQAVLLGPQFPQWTLKLLAPTVGAAIALVAALAAACFVRAFGITFLGRPRGAAAEGAREVDRFSLAAMGGLALALPARRRVPRPDDRRAETGRAVRGRRRRCRCNRSSRGCRSRRSREARSSYNGLLVFLFIADFGLARPPTAIHRLRLGRGPPRAGLGLRLSRADPATQYTAESFSQPIRRVFGGFAFGARETVDMPPPGRNAAGALEGRDARPDLGCDLRADRRRRRGGRHAASTILQFLTIRQYLSVVFGALVFLLLLLGGMAVMADSRRRPRLSAACR